MGKIRSTRRLKNDNVLVELECSQEEMFTLKGVYEDLFLFSENLIVGDTFIRGKGKNNSSKYFLIPLAFKNAFDNAQKVKYQVIEEKNKLLFVFFTDRRDK